MPALSNPLQTTIAIGGKLMSSLPNAVRVANMQLMSLNRTTMQVNQNMASMGRRMAAGLLSLGGLYGIVQIGRESVQLAKQDQDARQALTTLITNQNRLRGIGIEQSRQQVALLERQAQLYQDQSGIYSTILLKGATYLAQFKLTGQQIAQMQPAMVEILNYQRLMGRSAESMPEIYAAVGKGMMGQGRALKSIGIELTDMQQRLLKFTFMTGNLAANARMIANEIRRQHGGATLQFMQTLEGQATLAGVRIQGSIKQIGDALLPIVELGQIILSRFITPLTKHFEDLHTMIMSHWREIVRYLDTQIIPVFTQWVDQGWKMIVASVQWLIKNSSWLLPIVRLIGEAFIIWAVVLGPLSGFIASLFNPLNLIAFTASAIGVSLSGISAGVLEVITHTKDWQDEMGRLKKVWAGITEWWLGSDAVKAQGRRFHGGPIPGTTGGQFQEGVWPQIMKQVEPWKAKIGDWLQSIKKMVADWITDVLGMVAQNIWKWLGDQWNMLDQSVDNYIDRITAKQRTKLMHFFDPAIEGVKLVGKAILDYMLQPIRNVTEAWQEFLKSFGVGSQGISTYPPGSAQPQPLPGPTQYRGGAIYNPLVPAPYGPSGGPIRAETYGPRSAGATSADMRQIYGATVAGHKIALQSGVSAAVSPNLLGQYPIGTWVDEYQNGKLVRHRRVDDTSWIRSGVPTRNTIENYNDIDIGRVTLKRSPTQGPDGGVAGGAGGDKNVTLHYTVHHHHDGGGDLTSALEPIHRRQRDALSKIMEDAIYGKNRTSFDGADAI